VLLLYNRDRLIADNNIDVISHTRWSHWESKIATGHGDFSFSPIQLIPATMSAYRLLAAGNPNICVSMAVPTRSSELPGGARPLAETRLPVAHTSST
jgi:hypothetical protein